LDVKLNFTTELISSMRFLGFLYKDYKSNDNYSGRYMRKSGVKDPG
jgi:hypothetical protein